MSEATNMANRYGQTGHDVPTTTRFVSFDFYDKGGNRLSVKNMTKPVKIKIPRSKEQPALAWKEVKE
jgi:hypothetical protein